VKRAQRNVEECWPPSTSGEERSECASSWQTAFPDEACKAQSAKEYVFALPFKKHLGETLEEVMRKDLGYVECIVSTVRIDKLASLLNTALAELEWACGLRKI